MGVWLNETFVYGWVYGGIELGSMGIRSAPLSVSSEG